MDDSVKMERQIFSTLVDYNLLILMFNILTSVKAYTAVGYLGCYHKDNANMFDKIANSESNSGEECKQRCMVEDKGYSYAGTRKGNRCYCSTTFGTFESTNECKTRCKGNSSEFCGGDKHLSIHDMWKCAAVPCKNNASCEDIDGTKYTCTCTDGWTGVHCDKETLAGTTNTVTNTPATTSSTSVSPASSSTLVPSLSSQRSSIYASLDTSQTTTRDSAVSNSSIDNNSTIAVYVSVPVAIILLSLVAVVAFFLWRSRAKHRPDFRYHGSVPANNLHSVSSTSKEGCINHYMNHKDVTLNDEVVPRLTDNVYTEIDLDNLQPTSDLSINEYNTIELTTMEIPEHSYGHLIKGMAPFIDITYSHTDKYPTETKSESMDNTYSHIGNGTTEAMFKQTTIETNDTYNVLQTMSNSSEWNKKTKAKEYDKERDSMYDHAIAGSHDNVDEVAHLNIIAADTDLQRDGHIAALKDIINKEDDLSDNQRNGDYEQAVGHSTIYVVLESDDQVFAINDVPGKEQDSPYGNGTEYERTSNHDYFVLQKMDT